LVDKLRAACYTFSEGNSAHNLARKQENGIFSGAYIRCAALPRKKGEDM